jgi:predicted DCC family thiol-disulfide oxidoreductase YuxK
MSSTSTSATSDDTAPGGPPRLLSGPAAGPAKALARLAARPVRGLARVRPPAVEHPELLHPGDRPPTDGQLLLLFDGGCGICLHARDVFAVLDRRHLLAFDRIARHDRGLLADLTEEEKYSSWHVVHPDGQLESGSAGIAAALADLPAGALAASLVRRFSGPTERGYQWFARNRGWISRGSGLIDHPQRDPREQPGHDGHEDVVGP